MGHFLKAAAYGFVLTLLFGLPAVGAKTETGIRYSGRFDFGDPLRPKFTWSGSMMKAHFFGSSVRVTLSNSSTVPIYFVSKVDDEPFQRFATSPGKATYSLSAGLEAAEHTVTLARDTEGKEGITQFLGFDFGSEGKILAPPATTRLRLEFLGDSMSSGYGDLDIGPNCEPTSANESHSLAFPFVTAQLLGAEETTISYSGKGVYRNWHGSPNDPLNPTLMHDYAYALTPVNYSSDASDEGKALWDFSQDRAADAVVINLGTNDFSENLPPKENFVRAYQNLVELVRQKYPQAQVFCVVGSMLSGAGLRAAREFVGEVVARETTHDGRVHFVELPEQDSSQGLGCAWHPTVAQHARMARLLAGEISKYVAF